MSTDVATLMVKKDVQERRLNLLRNDSSEDFVVSAKEGY